MSSERNFADISSLMDRLIERESQNPSLFLPVILTLGREVNGERISLINSDSLTGVVSEKQGRKPATKSSVENLPRVVIGDCSEEKGSCAICLEEWLNDDVAAEMPCKHRFHSKCVEKWLKIHATCPLCRYEMPIEDEEKKIEIWFGFSINGDGSERRRRRLSGELNPLEEREV